MTLERAVAETRQMIQHFYQPSYLREHSAYFSDPQLGRISYAFGLCRTKPPLKLPALPFTGFATTAPALATMHKQILSLLNYPDETRMLFNIQMYYQESEVMQTKAGDLLIFDNIECEHGTDSFIASEVGRADG
jgi:hypothetical protein